jgi:hydrogenase large subunit
VSRVIIDPVTRIGGHLRVEAEVRGGRVEDAWSAGTMFRGMEGILDGRDPRDAWLLAQRVCGMCGGAHALGSVRAVEDALEIRIPRNARLLRNLLAGSEWVLDHAMSFYQLQLFDWVDVIAAAGADPAETARLAARTSSWTASTTTHFAAVRDRLQALIDTEQLGPLAHGYWGHRAYRLAPEANLLLWSHYVDALAFQLEFTQIHNLLGGKNPHPQTFLVGGSSLAPSWGGPRASPRTHPTIVDRNAPSPLTEPGLALLERLIAVARTFVDQVYLPDVRVVAAAYPEWFSVGAGTGRFLSFGEFPRDDTADPELFIPAGVIDAPDLGAVSAVDPTLVKEDTSHAHYEDDAGAPPRSPWSGRTDARYGGPPLPYETLAGAERYSWAKAPRYAGRPAETGALARMLLAYANGPAVVRPRLEQALSAVGATLAMMPSVMGRTVARAIEAQVVAYELEPWRSQLQASIATGDLAVAEVTRWDPASWPATADGISLGESPRGALGHWVRLRDRRIDAYQIVDGNTWNGSPRDANGVRGPWEEALVGTPVDDPARPLEILRTLHSFDPCATCAVHALDPSGRGGRR